MCSDFSGENILEGESLLWKLAWKHTYSKPNIGKRHSPFAQWEAVCDAPLVEEQQLTVAPVLLSVDGCVRNLASYIRQDGCAKGTVSCYKHTWMFCCQRRCKERCFHYWQNTLSQRQPQYIVQYPVCVWLFRTSNHMLHSVMQCPFVTKHRASVLLRNHWSLIYCPPV